MPSWVSRASTASVTPVVYRATVSRTRRASWADWYGAVGSCVSATVSPQRSLFGQIRAVDPLHDNGQTACVEGVLTD